MKVTVIDCSYKFASIRDDDDIYKLLIYTCILALTLLLTR